MGSSSVNSSKKVKDDALLQLDSVMTSMFKLIEAEVEPFIDDKQTKVSLKSYKALTQNLLKSLRQNTNTQHHNSSVSEK